MGNGLIGTCVLLLLDTLCVGQSQSSQHSEAKIYWHLEAQFGSSGRNETGMTIRTVQRMVIS